MVTEDHNRILEYLKKQGPTNTFRLARGLGIDRHEVLKIIKTLQEKGIIELKSGIVSLLKFPAREIRITKPVKVEKAPKKHKKRIKHITKKKPGVKREPKLVEEKSKLIEDVQDKYKKIEERLSELEKQSSDKSKILLSEASQLDNLKNHIDNLEKDLKKLSSTPPKIIRKTIIKREAVPVEIKKEPKFKFKLPKFKLKMPKLKLPKLNTSRIKDVEHFAKSNIKKVKIRILKIKLPEFKEEVKNISKGALKVKKELEKTFSTKKVHKKR
ncbi:MAG: helix-turn-helix domain-containing protein [bacterium]|nr:helix-turn-helix domain-containing protein [bacterium]